MAPDESENALMISCTHAISGEEARDLYASVGWSTYTREPDVLERALSGSSFVATARGANGQLLGLARAISDDATICYVQDILVRPGSWRAGIGCALLEKLKARYAHVRQTVLITDDEPGQRAFYESLGFTEGSEMPSGPVRTFLRFR